MRRLLLVPLTAALAAGCAAGCAPGPAAGRADAAQALGSIAQSLDTSTSAVATASLATGLWRDGSLPAVTADAALGDATRAGDEAVHELTTIVAPDAESLALRDDALRAAQDAALAVAATRTWVGGGLSADQATSLSRDLDDIADRLDEVTSAVEAAGEVTR